MKTVQEVPGVKFEDDENTEMKPLNEEARNTAIDALKNMGMKEMQSSPFKPKVKQALKKVQDDVFDALEECGYDRRSAGVQMAVSLLIDNLSRQ